MTATGAAALMPSISVDALLAARDGIFELFERFNGELRERCDQLCRFNIHPPTVEVSFVSSDFTRRLPDRKGDRWSIDDLRADIDRAVWVALFEGTNLTDIMDRKTADEFRRTLRGGWHGGSREAPPPVTAESIAATFEGMHARINEFYEAAVEAVFRALSWDYKTNTPGQFGDRLIVSSAWSYWTAPDSEGRIDRFDCDNLADLERVLCIALGDPIPCHTSGLRSVRQIKLGEWFEVPPTGTDSLFEAKLFKNRNAHVRFSPTGLEGVRVLNRIIAQRYPNALPPGTL